MDDLFDQYFSLSRARRFARTEDATSIPQEADAYNILGTIENQWNVPATVKVDEDGLEVSGISSMLLQGGGLGKSGTMTLMDGIGFGVGQYKSTYFEAGGALNRFLTRRVWNGGFETGENDSTIASTESGTGSTVADYNAGLSVNLPHWVVEKSSPDAGGAMLEWNLAGTNTWPNYVTIYHDDDLLSEEVIIYQDVPIDMARDFQAWFREKHNADASGTVALKLYWSWRDQTHAIVGLESSSTIATYTANQASYADTSAVALGTSPDGAYYLRLRVSVTLAAGTGNQIWLDDIFLQEFPNSLAASGTIEADKFIANSTSTAKDQLTIPSTTAGAGITIGTDTNLYRSAADTLKTDDDLIVGGSLQVNTNIETTTGDVIAAAGHLRAAGDLKIAGGDILMGTSGSEDLRLTRAAASDLWIDDNASTFGAVARVQGQFWVRQSLSTDLALVTGTGTNTTNMPFAMQADGKMNWGSGAAARDTNLYRSAANILKTDDSLQVGVDLDVAGDVAIAGGDLLYGTAGSEDTRIARTAARELTIDDNASHTNPSTLQIYGEVGTFRGAATNSVFTASLDTDSTPYRFLMKADGTLEWGAGGVARDTNLYRSAADSLTTDDNFDAASLATVGGLTVGGTADLQSTASVAGMATLGDGLVLGNIITPTAIAANTNSYLPTGGNTALVWRISASAAYNITGISASVTQTNGRMLLLTNVGSFTITLSHDVTSTAANRFYCPGAANFALTQYKSVWVQYNTTLSRWMVIG